jgi:lipopolysaccharide transport system ATP-binding protein
MITVSHLGKAYKQYPSRWSRLGEWLDPRNKPHHQSHWVLRDINITVKPGEAIGIIGVNGAGKSTLLKMITGTTQPTTGSVQTRGRVAALLELGMGFHPDFTGRQNVYMAGQLLGYRVEEITALMPQIEAFAEIDEYIDRPVRIYSSGMQVRLAFSVATAVRPDILIVDEALSVGDTYFQHKSFARIRAFRDAGTTLVFVSHSPDAIKTLCNRAILLDGGIVVRDGSPETVLDYYNAAIAKQEADHKISQAELVTGKTSTRSGTGDASIESVELLSDGLPVRAILSGVSVTLLVRGIARTNLDELTVGILIRDRLGNDVFGTNTYHHGLTRENVISGNEFIVDFSFKAFLGRGSYSVSVALHASHSHVADNYDWWDRALVFQVLPGELPYSVGVLDMPISLGWRERGVQNPVI